MKSKKTRKKADAAPKSGVTFWIKKIATDGGSKIVPTADELNAFASANGLISIEDAYDAQNAAMQMAFLGIDTGEVGKARQSIRKAQEIMKKERRKASRLPRYKGLETKKMVAEIPDVRNVFVYLGILEATRKIIESPSFGVVEDDDDDDFLDDEFFDD